MFNPSQNLLGKFRCLSQKSDCLLFALARTLALAVSANFSLACLSSLYRFQGSRRCLCSRADNVDYYSLSLRFCQQLFSTFFLLIICTAFLHAVPNLFLRKSRFFIFSLKTLFCCFPIQTNLQSPAKNHAHRILSHRPAKAYSFSESFPASSPYPKKKALFT